MIARKVSIVALLGAFLLVGLPASVLAQAVNQEESLNVSSLHEADGAQKIAALNGLTVDQLEGADIINNRGEKIGDVGTFLAANDNKVIAVIAETGGFFGIGATEVLVPLRDLRYDTGRSSFVIDKTAEQLKGMRKIHRGPRGNLM